MTENFIRIILLCVMFIAGCDFSSSWDDVDYSSIADDIYENDDSYVLPSSLTCLNSDLFSCD
ncbi:MAG: hypothetical protein R3D71_01010 [Rickettsiales bacterium]